MKILLLTQVLPYPPDSGPKAKTWTLIKYLSEEHEVVLASFVRGDQSKEVNCLRNYCHSIHTVSIRRTLPFELWAFIKSIFSGAPWIILRDSRASMHKLVEKLCLEQNFDVIHADQLNMAQYALGKKINKTVLDEHNALWLLYRRLADQLNPGLKRWVFNREAQLLKRYEGEVCNKFDLVLAVSDEDKQSLIRAGGSPDKISILPIAVDTEEILPVQRKPDADQIVFIGTMFWPPNGEGVKWFITQVFPLIKKEKPRTILNIIGAGPSQGLITLANNIPDVNIMGFVEDLTPYLINAGVMIVPLFAGSGMRVKILNGLAQCLPIVSTTVGCEGIDVKNGENILIADTPVEFAQSVLFILGDRIKADDLGVQGRRLVIRKYDYRETYKYLEQVLQSGTKPDSIL